MNTLDRLIYLLDPTGTATTYQVTAQQLHTIFYAHECEEMCDCYIRGEEAATESGQCICNYCNDYQQRTIWNTVSIAPALSS